MNAPGRRPPNEPALPYAVRLLSARSYSVRKLKEKLKHRGYPADEIEQAIERLRQKNLLSDDRFAEGFVRTRLESRPRGRTALMRDLMARGVEAGTARKAVDEAIGPGDELAVARELVCRKAPQYAKLDAVTRQRRLFALLARRGFKPDTIRHALTLSEDDDNSEERT